MSKNVGASQRNILHYIKQGWTLQRRCVQKWTLRGRVVNNETYCLVRPVAAEKAAAFGPTGVEMVEVPRSSVERLLARDLCVLGEVRALVSINL